jgi:hypothetical protein
VWFTSLRDVIPIFAKMPIFGFLIILSVWIGNAYYEGTTLGKTGEYSKTAFQWLKMAFNLLSFKLRTVFMNKRIIAVSIIMLMACTMVAFAQNRDVDELLRSARSSADTASTARSRGLSSYNASYVLQEMNRIYAEYERIANRFNSLVNSGIEINDNNRRAIQRDLDRIQEFFNDVKNHHSRLLM